MRNNSCGGGCGSLREAMRRGARESVAFARRRRGWRNLHEVEEHQARVQLAGSGDLAILFFLFFGAEHKIKAVVFVVADGDFFVIGIYDKVTASRLVVFVDEPAFDALHQLRSNALAQELAVDTEPSDQDSRIDHVALLLRHTLPNALPSRVWKMVREYACIGDCKCADDFARIVNFKEGVGLAHQLLGVVEIIRCKELVKVFVSAAERSASGNYIWCERNADALVIQKGHLPDSLSFLTRLAFSDSKLRHISRSTEKSMRPRLRAFSSAVRTKRIAASPDKTGMLLIARAISDLPFTAYYSKKRVNVFASTKKLAI